MEITHPTKKQENLNLNKKRTRQASDTKTKMKLMELCDRNFKADIIKTISNYEHF